jgi:hypothetical protein
LSTHLHLGLPSGLFPCGFPTNTPICIPLSPHSCSMPCPSHPPWFDHFNYIWRTVQVMKLLILQYSPTSYRFISNAQLILFTWRFYLYLEKSKCYEAPQGADFPNLLSLHLILFQIFSSTPSVFIITLMWKTEFHTHTESQEQLYFCVL